MDSSRVQPDALPQTLPDRAGGDSTAHVGTVLARRYRLRARLGAGGHGDVWDADDLLTRDRVAVKMLRRGEQISAARARREIAVLRFLRVPGVVHLLDEGVEHERVFLVMERIDGAHFPGRPVPCSWEDLRAPALGLLETLARIHAAGVVHRDIKPANVIVDANGRPTVLDFGLSHIDIDDGGALTGENEMVGTPAYLAPEQISGAPVSPRTDLYAVGLMLYEALAGQRPHETSELRRLMRVRLTQRPTPIRDLAADVPPRVAEVLTALLAVEPEQRPRSAHEVIAALRGDTTREASAFPRLGGDHPVRALANALASNESRDVTGALGSGRTRLLHDVAALLSAQGRTVRFLAPSRRAFASLDAIAPVPQGSTDADLTHVAAAVEADVLAALRAGVVLVADDADRIDRASADLLERCREFGAVVRVWTGPPRPGAIHLAPLDERDLQSLFAGPDRLLHLREDGARALRARTEGSPQRVREEVESWIRAGLCRWDGLQLVISRDALNRLDDGRRIGASIDEQPVDLPEHLADLAAWVALAQPDATPDVLVRAMGEARWRVQAELRDLESLAVVQIESDGRITPRIAVSVHERWSDARCRRASRALAGALHPGAASRLRHLIASADGSLEDAVQIAHEAHDHALQLARTGHLGRAVVALGEGRRVLRDSGDDASATDRLLSLWVEVALADGTEVALDRVLYEICRATVRTPRVSQLESLVRAALAVNQWTDRALDAIEAVPRFDDARLERCRHGVRVSAARRASLGREERALDEIAAALAHDRDPSARAALDGWLGRLRYRQGEFEEAARIQTRCAEVEMWVSSRIAAQLNAASAFMEAFDLAAARRWADEARVLARSCRHVYGEARAEWILRQVALRAGAPGGPDRELLEAASQIAAPQVEATIALGEAAVAFRGRDPSSVREFARQSHRIWSESGEPLGVLLSAALLAASGEPVGSAGDLVARAVACPARGVGIQVCGLLALANGAVDVSAIDVASMSERVPREHWHQPLDVLSVHESLAALGYPARP